MNIMKVCRVMHQNNKVTPAASCCTQLCNALVPPPTPSQPHYVDMPVPCRITLQPVSLDVRLEPKGADEVYIVYLHAHVSVNMHSSSFFFFSVL